MQGSTPQHYTIADFLKWNDDKELILNPKFQRGPVWSGSARSYLIDSIIRGYPIPKLLIRTKVDRDSRRTVRDVVDGQQRLRAIIDFAGNRLVLGIKAQEYRGLRYQDLSDDEKDAFLSYKLTCEQLINASDEDVLEVFTRINSNAIPIVEPELRNARFDNEFSDFVKSIVRSVPQVWRLGVLSDRERVRMADQSVIAEIVGFFLQGVSDGGEANITKLYERVSAENFDLDTLPSVDNVIRVCNIAAELLAEFTDEPIARRPHFLMLVAAIIYASGELPEGKLSFGEAVPRDAINLDKVDDIVDCLRQLNISLSVDSEDEIPASLRSFRSARATTQRMKSRQERFKFFCSALAGRVSGADVN
jgi:hypothetical protein